MRVVIILLVCMFFVSCGKNKEVTETKNVDSTANKNTVVDQEKQRLEKENQELKEKLKQQENKIDQEPMGGDEDEIAKENGEDFPSDNEAMKEVKKELMAYGKGGSYGGTEILDAKIVGRVPKGDRCVIQATAHIYLNVRARVPYKEEKKLQIEVFYKKFGNEWTWEDTRGKTISSKDIGRQY